MELTLQEDQTARIREWAGAERLLIALDFDGTLAPFRDDPMAVSIVAGGAEVLAGLAALERVQLALVSGRRLADLAALAAPPPGTLLAGSHGAERGHVSPSGELEVEAGGATEAELALLAELTASLESIVASAPGSWVEHKTFGRVLHTRKAEPEDAERATEEALTGPGSLPGVHTIHGKRVVEIAVRSVTKADAVAAMRAQVADASGVGVDRVAVLFAGDDTTDEFALASLVAGDLGVKVGEGESAASLRVADEAAMVTLLGEVLRALRASA
ncbi:trehalose-phosphatase [Serinibacter salmoneus]|uniref:trehalose-phosphatase n=1 Tax=Serinibacter salmoneus TaxID=556530 RepID=UPI00147661C4|nr:trehalose-phosphatase [Serinibacter salmoneus]